jgi:cytidyltransferase-like protein
MNDIDLFREPPGAPPRAVGAYLGSFDPPHLGHAFVVRELLRRFDRVLVLVPARHFEKRVDYPRNATFEQRLRMLDSIVAIAPDRVGTGLTREVLYLRLAEQLRVRHPGAAVGFGMGDDSHARFLASREYYAREGLPWGAEQDTALRVLDEHVVVFARHGTSPHAVRVPDALQNLSSTRVRQMVARGREGVAALVGERVAGLIEVFRLYGRS